jgi:hypothetical protein
VAPAAKLATLSNLGSEVKAMPYLLSLVFKILVVLALPLAAKDHYSLLSNFAEAILQFHKNNYKSSQLPFELNHTQKRSTND